MSTSLTVYWSGLKWHKSWALTICVKIWRLGRQMYWYSTWVCENITITLCVRGKEGTLESWDESELVLGWPEAGRIPSEAHYLKKNQIFKLTRAVNISLAPLQSRKEKVWLNDVDCTNEYIFNGLNCERFPLRTRWRYLGRVCALIQIDWLWPDCMSCNWRILNVPDGEFWELCIYGILTILHMQNKLQMHDGAHN